MPSLLQRLAKREGHGFFVCVQASFTGVKGRTTRRRFLAAKNLRRFVAQFRDSNLTKKKRDEERGLPEAERAVRGRGQGGPAPSTWGIRGARRSGSLSAKAILEDPGGDELCRYRDRCLGGRPERACAFRRADFSAFGRATAGCRVSRVRETRLHDHREQPKRLFRCRASRARALGAEGGLDPACLARDRTG